MPSCMPRLPYLFDDHTCYGGVFKDINILKSQGRRQGQAACFCDVLLTKKLDIGHRLVAFVCNSSSHPPESSVLIDLEVYRSRLIKPPDHLNDQLIGATV